MEWWVGCLTFAVMALGASVVGLTFRVQRLTELAWHMNLPHMRTQSASQAAYEQQVAAINHMELLDAEQWGNLTQQERDRIRRRMS